MQKFITPLVRILLVCSCLVGMLTVAIPAQAAPLLDGPQNPAELEAFLDGVIGSQMTEKHVAGVVVTVVKDGNVLLSKGYGYADLETRKPVDPDQTLFRPGSVSKLFVWTAVMQLVEHGKLDLNADINNYLDFVIPATFPEPITLEHLLTHTPGFEENNQDIAALHPEKLKSLVEYLKTNLPQRVFMPGKVLAYSNYGAALAAYIVERVSGLAFDAYVEQNIFIPLGMQHSTFRQPLPTDLVGEMASGYNYLDGAYQKGDFELIQASPAGSLSATASDMARFMIAHLQNGLYGEQRILQETTAIQMRQLLFTHDASLGGMAYGFFKNTVNGQDMVWHGGDTILFHTGLFLFPEQNLGLFISTNSPDGESIVAAVMKAFPKHYYPVNNAGAPRPTASFSERLAPYVGEYFSARNNYTTIEKTFSLFDPLDVSLGEDGYLLLSMYGETHQYVEVKPGLLREREQPENQMIYGMNDTGQAYLALTNRPFDYLKAPWYGNSKLHFMLIGTIMLLFGLALVRWASGFLKHLRKQEVQPVLARLAHWAAGLFGLLLVGLLVCFLAVLSNNAPVYEMPYFLFVGEAAPLLKIVLFLPWLLGPLAFAMLLFSILAWLKKYWSLGGRIFYSLLSLCALAGMWMLLYWNF